jgi:hypothetical protein
MSDDSAQQRVRSAVALSAICMAAIGGLLLFAPAEMTAMLLVRTDNTPLVQLLGAALLGFAAMKWIARSSLLGGIYGKSVLAGNQTHFTVGALLLLKHGLVAGGSAAYWALTGVYVLGAGLFLYLVFGTGIETR